jgi:hypothetical protein
MTLAEFYACIDGWKRANGAEDKPPPPTDQEFDEMQAEIDRAEGR